jgi:hypothetical protein
MGKYVKRQNIKFFAGRAGDAEAMTAPVSGDAIRAQQARAFALSHDP